jgi:dUTP pyrophosphatase
MEDYGMYIMPCNKNINVKKLNDLAKLPSRGSEYAAGYDLYAATDCNIEIPSHTTVKIGTGLSFELPQGTFAAIFPRSGIATKRGLRPANCVGE